MTKTPASIQERLNKPRNTNPLGCFPYLIAKRSSGVGVSGDNFGLQ